MHSASQGPRFCFYFPASPLPRFPASPPPRFPAYFSSPFAIVCSCMLLVPS